MTSASIVSKLVDLAETGYIDFGQIGLGGLTDTLLKKKMGSGLSTSHLGKPETR